MNLMNSPTQRKCFAIWTSIKADRQVSKVLSRGLYTNVTMFRMQTSSVSPLTRCSKCWGLQWWSCHRRFLHCSLGFSQFLFHWPRRSRTTKVQECEAHFPPPEWLREDLQMLVARTSLTLAFLFNPVLFVSLMKRMKGRGEREREVEDVKGWWMGRTLNWITCCLMCVLKSIDFTLFAQKQVKMCLCYLK